MNLLAQTAVGHVLNTLPEGLLLAACAWLLLRLFPRQNSGTRFAIWLVALAGVAALPFLETLHSGALSAFPQPHPEITLSPFWAAAFLLLWIPISFLALARVVAGIWQVRRIRRSCREVPFADLDPALRDLFADLKRPVRLLVSDQASVPAAMGFRHPVVVLPTWTLRDLPTDQLRHILIHELAHIRRHDDWTNLVQKIARAVFFFHPAVWWIDARLSLEREMACDEAVLAATGNPHAYAGCLIDLLERGCARRGWTMAQAAVARARDASIRIARILQGSHPGGTRVGRRALALAAGVSLACSGMVLCSPGFVSFAPVHSSSSDVALAASGLEGSRPPSSDVVPAMYHPARAPRAQFAALRADLRHVHPSHAAPAETRNLVPQTVLARNQVRSNQESRASVVMASLKKTPRAQPLVSSAYFILQSTQYEIQSTQDEAAAAQRPPSADAASVDEGSVLRVQTFQVVRRDAQGIQVQVFQLVMRVPAEIAMEGAAKSI